MKIDERGVFSIIECYRIMFWFLGVFGVYLYE